MGIYSQTDSNILEGPIGQADVDGSGEPDRANTPNEILPP